MESKRDEVKAHPACSSGRAVCASVCDCASGAARHWAGMLGDLMSTQQVRKWRLVVLGLNLLLLLAGVLLLLLHTRSDSTDDGVPPNSHDAEIGITNSPAAA